MLKGIPPVISPELIAIADVHGSRRRAGDRRRQLPVGERRPPPAAGRWPRRAAELLDAILRFFPLDPYVPQPVALMAVVPGDTAKTEIWDEYRRIVQAHEPSFRDFELVERFAFYERARAAYAVLATSEMAIYANIILKKVS